MSPELVTVVTFGLLFGLVAIGIPLAFATLATAIVIGFTMFGPQSTIIIASRIYDNANNYVLITVPLFIIMGILLERGGIAARIFSVLHLWTARLPGGMAIGVVLAGSLMAAMVGVVGAEIITLGLVALPTMLKRGYNKKIALGTIIAAGSLGAMIPPSLVLVFYALIANVSIAELYAAALLPGLLLALLYAIYIFIRCVIDPSLAPPPPAEELNLPLKDKILMAKDLFLPMAVVFAVLGSLYFGIATPTESAAIGVAGALVAIWINGKFRLSDMRDIVLESGRAIGPVMWIFFGATAFVGIYTFTGGITYLTNLIAGLPLPPIGILIVMQIILILLGLPLDWIGIALLTMPVFVPVIKQLGYDPLWFGVLFCINMQIGYLSPPFGPSSFYLKSVAPPEVSLQDILKSVWPFMGLQLLGLIIVMMFPEIALWLPSLMR
ncbi:TRAP transporter large permease [Microvirga pudoricolor]|uniref:TRAP transporter large permease n=1 Tax=Microvirga pudoricolor TaxID=2778729 RepID=UPI001950B802|nr:TRAP transporter large permease subunit [Microvirga pudoricolor]MBM6596699.1 TRAP transporter large permease subunit [Microvirga pudoricolor]